MITLPRIYKLQKHGSISISSIFILRRQVSLCKKCLELKKENVLRAQSLIARSAYVKFDVLGTKLNISSATRQPTMIIAYREKKFRQDSLQTYSSIINQKSTNHSTNECFSHLDSSKSSYLSTADPQVLVLLRDEQTKYPIRCRNTST